MPLSKVLWASLTGCITIIALLIGSWMESVNAQELQAQQRLTTMEQHFASIQSDLQFLREDMRDVKKELSGGKR